MVTPLTHRFIPDDVAFEEEPRDVATDVNLAAYTPKLFTSAATTTSKVRRPMEVHAGVKLNVNKQKVVH